MRYQVIDGSASYHCCFEASVMDSEAPDFPNANPVCECFNREDAEKIAAALNSL